MRNQEYTIFGAEFTDILSSDGQLTLPNVQEITDLQEALNHISASSSKLPHNELIYKFRIQNFREPTKSGQTHEICYYPKFFLNGRGMGGRFDGSGCFICTPSGRSQEYGAKVFTFAFCVHDWDVSGANHSRGWHPQVCKKCGFDASIDSGD